MDVFSEREQRLLCRTMAQKNVSEQEVQSVALGTPESASLCGGREEVSRTSEGSSLSLRGAFPLDGRSRARFACNASQVTVAIRP